MIVGRREINVEELIQHSSTTDEFLEYADSLVPEMFRNVPGIKGNQRYLCCLAFRNSERVSWDKKKELLPYLFSKSRLCGYIDSITELADLSEMLDINKVIQYGQKEGKDVSQLISKRNREGVRKAHKSNKRDRRHC